jgi:hypothetical protein
MLIVYVIVAVIALYVLEVLLATFITLPPPVMVLIRLLIGLLVLIAFLNCTGLLSGGFGMRFEPRR